MFIVTNVNLDWCILLYVSVGLEREREKERKERKREIWQPVINVSHLLTNINIRNQKQMANMFLFFLNSSLVIKDVRVFVF